MRNQQRRRKQNLNEFKGGFIPKEEKKTNTEKRQEESDCE